MPWRPMGAALRGLGLIRVRHPDRLRENNGAENSHLPIRRRERQQQFFESRASASRFRPAGIHVAVIILDGIVDLEATRKRMPDKPDDFFVDPAGLAEIAWDLTRQSRRAWSLEVEARPFGENW